MKKTLLLSIVLLCGYFAFAQTVLFEDNFDSYTAGETVSSQSPTPGWFAWDGTAPEQAFVSDEQAYSGSNSMKLIANNDMILSLGNKTSGVYQVEFRYYVPTGKKAYFNMQHAFADEWAFSCTFAAGTMTLANGAATAPTFSYTQDTWLYFDVNINLGTDIITLDLDGTELASWTFSTKEEGGAGLNQLGCMNFYAPPAAANTYFVDNFVYTQIESGITPPTIDLTITPIITATGENENVSFGNTGEENMNFSAYPVFDNNFTGGKNGAKDGILNIAGDYEGSGIGWTAETTGFVATRFAPEIVRPFIGQEITSVDVAIGNLPLNSEIIIYVWGKGGFITPGANTILSQKTKTVEAGSWNSVDLDAPILLNGEEIWVGYGFTQPVDSFCVGSDGTANVPGANYKKLGPVWSEFTGIDGEGNWNIKANVTGASWPVWMSVTPANGTVAAAGSQNLTVSFDNTNLADGEYTGNVIIGCNDQESEWNTIPVTSTVFVGIDNIKQSVTTYPNPTSGIFNIETSSTIENVEIYNTAGQLVNSLNINNSKCTVDFSNLSGIFIVKINTTDGQIIRRVIAE